MCVLALAVAFGCAKESTEQPPKSDAKPSDKTEAPTKPKGVPKATLVIDGRADYGSMAAHGNKLLFAPSTTQDGPRHFVALGAGTPELIATKIGRRVAFVSDVQSIWWLDIAEDRTALHTISAEGQGWSAAKLVTDAIPPDESRAWDLALTTDYVYITGGTDGLLRVARTGGELETVFKQDGAHVGTIAAAGSAIYWIVIDKDFAFHLYASEDATIAKPELVETAVGMRGLGATPEALYWSRVPSEGAQFELTRRKRGGAPEKLASWPEDILDIVPGDGLVALELWSGVGIWREGSDKIEQLEDKGMYAPEIAVVGSSMMWMNADGVRTTEGAPFLAARDFLPLPPTALRDAGN